MLTILSVDRADKNKLFPIFGRLRTEQKNLAGEEVRFINFTRRRGKIHWKKIESVLGDDKTVLCREGLEIPESSHIRRFDCNELRIRLCLNMALAAMEMVRDKAGRIKVGIYDPCGKIADSTEAFFKFTDSVTVVTKAVDLYTVEADRIMQEQGAHLRVTKRLLSIENVHLVISPDIIKCRLPLKKQSVILTTDKPMVSQNCTLLSKYYFVLENGVSDLLPEGIDTEYFASALYTLCRRYYLGSLVPMAAKGTGAEHTLVSLSKYLINIASNT